VGFVLFSPRSTTALVLVVVVVSAMVGVAM
jgi:hypothetical protein